MMRHAARRGSDRSETYRIVVRGRLTEHWSDWFDGMSLATEKGKDGRSTTILTGPVTDQAALRSLLSRIWDMNLVVISISAVESGANGPES